MAKARENRGGPGGPSHKFEKPKNVRQTLKRILSYMGAYRMQLIAVVACIIVSALAGVAGTFFIKPIINDHVVPFIGRQDPDLSGFVRLILIVAAIYVIGIICTYIYQRLMINI